MAGLVALHSAGGHGLTHSVTSVAAPQQVAGAATLQLPGDSSPLSTCDAGCGADCAIATASCTLLFVLAAVALLPAPAFALARTLSSWPTLLRRARDRLVQRLPGPSLLELSISRV